MRKLVSSIYDKSLRELVEVYEMPITKAGKELGWNHRELVIETMFEDDNQEEIRSRRRTFKYVNVDRSSSHDYKTEFKSVRCGDKF